MNGHGTFLARCNSVNGKLGAGVYIATHKNIFLCRLIGQAVCHSAVAATQLHLGAVQQVTPFNRLANAQVHMAARHGLGLVLVINRGKAAVLVQHGQALLKHNTGDLAVLRQDLLGTPAAVHIYALNPGFFHLFNRGRHSVPALQAEHRHAVCTAAHGGTSHINRHIAAANYNHFTLYRVIRVAANGAQKVYSGHDALGVLTGNTRLAAALATNSDIKGLVALGAQFVQGNILAHFNAAANVYTHFTDHINLRSHHIFF